MKKFNVAFGADEKFIQHLAVALQSLLFNNKKYEFNIYIINSDIGNVEWQKLEKITLNYKCKLINVLVDDDVLNNLVTTILYTKAVYYRLLIPNFIDDDVVLYLDSDIVINGSIKNLFDIDLEDYYVGAVQDLAMPYQKSLRRNLSLKSEYFNSGVLLINNKLCKTDNIMKKVIDFIDENYETIVYVDQDGLNEVLKGRWKKLLPKYNQLSYFFDDDWQDFEFNLKDENQEEAMKNPVIIHYTGFPKPSSFWNNHPYKNLYWKYLKKTPFKRYIHEDLTVLNVIKRVIPKSIKKFIKWMIYKDASKLSEYN